MVISLTEQEQAALILRDVLQEDGLSEMEIVGVMVPAANGVGPCERPAAVAARRRMEAARDLSRPCDWNRH